MMRRNLRRSIRKSFGRFAAIAMIIALGAGIFVGLRSTKTDMVATGQTYMDEQNMFDLRLISTYGWDKEQLETISQMDGVEEAEGTFYTDLIAQCGSSTESAVYRFYTIPEKINQLVLLEGRMPTSANECLADGFRNTSSALGQTVTISEDNESSSLDELNETTFTVVGLVSTPLYMDSTRGNTSVGSGSITNYFFVLEDAFDVDYYTEIYVTIPGDYTVYSQEYNDALSAAADALEPLLEPLAQERMESAKQEAEQAYQDGLEEYQQGLEDYQKEKADAEQELADSRQELEDGEAELAEAEQQLADAQQEVEDGEAELEASKTQLEESSQALTSAQASGQTALSNATSQLAAQQAELESAAQQVASGITQIDSALVEIASGITQIKTGLLQIEISLSSVESLQKIAQVNEKLAQQTLDNLQSWGASETTLQAAREALQKCQENTAEYDAKISELTQQSDALNAQLDELEAQQTQLETQRSELEAQQTEIRSARQQILAGYSEISSQRTSVDSQISSGYQQIASGQQQIQEAEEELREAQEEIEAGQEELEQSKQELADGWEALEEAEQEAEEKFAEAEQELADAWQELQDAKETIEGITETDAYVLDRTSNVGYSSLDSNSDIVAGIARVFPVFFVLVAALVCITTMTRMVDEERVQIGTLKALGYSNLSIISKYLKYAGFSAILGCGTGVVVGSILFPMVLWQAYKMVMFVTPNIELRFDWEMALSVTAMYTAAMLLVTWYCCHRSLREVPAELIRPKPPTSGRALLIERLPLWRRVRFLDKVSIRNIFRYRQRLVMMLLGIGGCTALLMTGFGIQDSISDIANIQFEDVTKYDVEVYFADGQTEEEQEAFRESLGAYAQDILFFNQVSGEVTVDGQTRDIYIITAPENLTDFMDLHKDGAAVSMPGTNEVLLSTGIADILNIEVGDTVELRNPDMQVLTLTVSGIYENHVYNYAIISPETVESQWGESPEWQMAVITVQEGRSVKSTGALARKQDGVGSVTVNQELAETVDSMMEALDLVVFVVVICAGILAAIVLYNLTNININERIREIATIKVLGFTAGETAMYVFKENLILSVFGALFGIPLGKLLLKFVISQIKVDMVWFDPILSNQSLLISVALTLVFAVLVDIFFYSRLDRINMAEALKSVE